MEKMELIEDFPLDYLVVLDDLLSDDELLSDNKDIATTINNKQYLVNQIKNQNNEISFTIDIENIKAFHDEILSHIVDKTINDSLEKDHLPFWTPETKAKYKTLSQVLGPIKHTPHIHLYDEYTKNINSICETAEDEIITKSINNNQNYNTNNYMTESNIINIFAFGHHGTSS